MAGLKAETIKLRKNNALDFHPLLSGSAPPISADKIYHECAKKSSGDATFAGFDHLILMYISSLTILANCARIINRKGTLKSA